MNFSKMKTINKTEQTQQSNCASDGGLNGKKDGSMNLN